MVAHHLLTPYLPVSKLPESERDAARIIQNALFRLESYVEDLHGARTLFDFANVQLVTRIGQPMSSDMESMRNWPFIAARDGAMTIYHFAKTLDGIRQSLPETPSLSGVDHHKLREARRNFRAHFPQFESIRHGVAHSAELIRDSRSLARNAADGPYDRGGIKIGPGAKSVFMQNLLNGRDFTLTIDGKHVSYELSEATVFNLAQVRTLIFGAFPFSQLDQFEAARSGAPREPNQTPHQ